jgi:hypothetical protein
MLLPCPFALGDRVHRKRLRTGKPDRIAGALVEFEEGIAVARHAVTDARTLGQRAGPPYQIAGLDQHLVLLLSRIPDVVSRYAILHREVRIRGYTHRGKGLPATITGEECGIAGLLVYPARSAPRQPDARIPAETSDD